MSQYLVLIYEDEAGYVNGGEAVGNEVMAGHMAFGEKHGPAIAGGNALQPAATATSLRSNAAGEFTVTDGPFAETKEALGGYYLIEAGDLDAAIAIAKDIPARFGGLEIRPVRVFD